LEGPFPTNDLYTIFTVSELTNPGYASTFTIRVRSYTNTNSEIDSSDSSPVRFTTSAGSLSVTLESGGSTVVGASTNLEVTVSVENEVDSSGYIEIYWPKWNPGTQDLSNVKSMFSYSSSDFSSANGGYLLDCSASGQSGITCVLIVANPSSVSAIPSSIDTLRITNLARSITSSVTVNIRDSRFRNPYSTKPITTMVARTLTSSGITIDQQSTGITYSANSASTLSSSGIDILPLSTVINGESQYDVTIYVSQPLPVGTTLQVIIPPQISLYEDPPYNTILLLSSAIGYTPISPSLKVDITSVSDASSKLELSNIVPSPSYYVDEGQSIKFSLLLLKNPGASSISDPFRFTFYDSGYEMMTASASDFEFSLEAGSLSYLSLELSNYRTREEVEYTFTFTIEDQVPEYGQIFIDLPPDLEIDEDELRMEPVQTISEKMKRPGYDEDARRLILSNAFQEATDAPATVEFIITRGIKNPSTTRPTPGLVVSTADQYGNVIGQAETDPIVASANTIEEIEVSIISFSEDGTTSTSQPSTYILNVHNGFDYPILINSYIAIRIPIELEMENS